MKDYQHIDELIRQKFEGFEAAPPDSVWEKVRDQIGPDAPPPKGSHFTLPIITGLVILIGLVGLLLLIGRMESTMQVQAGTKDLQFDNSHLNTLLASSQQIADASSFENLNNTTPAASTSDRILTNTSIPVRKPFDGQPAFTNELSSNEPQAVTSRQGIKPVKKRLTNFSRFTMDGKTFNGELHEGSYHNGELAARIVGKAGQDEDYVSSFKPQWSIGFHFNPEVSFYSADDISNGLNYSIQVLPRVNFRNFYIQSGLGMRTGGDRGNYLINYNKYLGTYEDVYDITFDSTENGIVPTYHTQTVDVYDTVPYYSISESKARFSYLDIPILIGHEWNFNKISLFLHAGPSVSILLGRSSPEADYPDENIRILNESPQIPARDLVSWQVMAGAGFNYAFSDRVSFGLEPTFRYYLSNEYEKGSMNTRHPYSFGIRAGLIYHINH